MATPHGFVGRLIYSMPACTRQSMTAPAARLCVTIAALLRATRHRLSFNCCLLAVGHGLSQKKAVTH
jgi:hypothetical protein